ncbi:MAG: hypothetical protein IKU12_05285 [Oscillospiraceae bacterium]|nr:hypothetical protein [Oscillospiraceae bacterium]
MHKTVQSVFDIAIHLMDAQNAATGGTDTADTREYALRTPALINSLLDRVYRFSDTFAAAEGGRRAVCPKVREMSDTLALDEGLCTAVLPYGLAALLLSEENPSLANFFYGTFVTELREFGAALAAEFEQVEDIYGGI